MGLCENHDLIWLWKESNTIVAQLTSLGNNCQLPFVLESWLSPGQMLPYFIYTITNTYSYSQLPHNLHYLSN